MKSLKVIISGGGTGGHIFPAIAIANALKAATENIEFLFVGAMGRMEMEKVPAAGYQIEGLPISGFQRRLTMSNLIFPFKLVASLIKAKKIVKSWRPDVAVGTGGYASGPLLNVAAGYGIPTLIQEQNSYPGITNKLLGRKVNKICVAYEGMVKFFPKEKIILTGNPVRKDINNLESKRAEAFNFFGLKEGVRTVLVIGGSLGARTINLSIAKELKGLAGIPVQLIWQTGKVFFPQAEETIRSSETKGMKAFDFISRMDLAYAAADIVVSRAGAISLSELAVAGKACILIPSPNVAEDHQTRNARTLVDSNAAILVRDSEAFAELGTELKALVKDEARQKQLQENIRKMARPDAAEKIAREILNLIC